MDHKHSMEAVVSGYETYDKNLKALFNQAPLLAIEPKKPASSINWVLSRTYVNFNKSDMSNKMAQMYNTTLSNNKLAMTLKVMALHSTDNMLSIGLIDEIKSFNPKKGDILGYIDYPSSRDAHVFSGQCNLYDTHNCKSALSHEFGHHAIKTIFGSLNPYLCLNNKCDQTKKNKFQAATFETLKNLAKDPLLRLTSEDKQKASMFNDYNELGKFIHEVCQRNTVWPTQLCVINDGFCKSYTDDQRDIETIANYVEFQYRNQQYSESIRTPKPVEMIANYLRLQTLSQKYSESVTTILKPLDDYWEQEIEPLIEKHINDHPNKDLVI